MIVHSLFEMEDKYSGNDQKSLITIVWGFVCLCLWFLIWWCEVDVK